MADDLGQVELVNNYRWGGDPRIARFHLYVDGKKAGSAQPLGGSCEVNVSPGRHTARIRFWWYFSPPLALDVLTGQRIRLVGDIPRKLSVPKRMARLLLHPLTSLELRVDGR